MTSSNTTDDKRREEILGKIELAVRTQFFNEHRKNMEFLADDIESLIAQAVKAGEDEWRTLIVKKYKRLVSAIFAVKPYLDQPYPDDKRWTPYTRFISPRLKSLEAAITKGEDIGELAALATTKETK